MERSFSWCGYQEPTRSIRKGTGVEGRKGGGKLAA